MSAARIILKHKAVERDTLSEEGYTPLHLAIKQNDVNMVQLLLNFGAKPDTVDKFGNFPIHFAVERGN